jgi:uncharacterized protein (TIGR03067 family)
VRKSLLLLALLALGFAPAPFPRTGRGTPGPAGDLAALQGKWVEREGGNQRGRGQTGEYRIVVTGSRLAVHVGDDLRTEWVITLDESARPRGMTLRPAKGGDPLEAVYSVERDTFIFCYPLGAPRGTRPAALDSGPGRKCVTLRRDTR